MSLKLKNDGRLKMRAHGRPSAATLKKLWAKGSTRPRERAVPKVRRLRTR